MVTPESIAFDLRFPHAEWFDRRTRRTDPAAWSDRSAHGMVATAHYLATAAGVGMLEAGGNAMDAAVAASFALSVCEPANSGLGGMAMMVVHLAGSRRTFVLDGACPAPRAATARAVSAAPERYFGHAAVAVPTLVAVMRAALERHGTLAAPVVLAPAIRLAREGVPSTHVQSHLAARAATRLRAGAAGALLLAPDGSALSPGSLLRQPKLARTLERLAADGLEDFHRGAIAGEIERDMQRHGGFVAREDLAAAADPPEKSALIGRAGELICATVGPPGGGLTLLEMLRIHAAFGDDAPPPDSPEWCALVAAIIRRAREDRRRYRFEIGPESNAVPLNDDAHAAAAAEEIRRAFRGDGETTHVSVADRHGNVVALTQSLERIYGARVAHPELGLVYNGYLKAFKIRNRSHPHYLRPGAVARSNAAPTILFRGGRPWAALGSTGSERMASGIFEVALRLFARSPFEAVHAPRLHCTPDGRVLLERRRFAPEARKCLERHGFRLKSLASYSFHVGGLQLVAFDGGAWVGVADPRRDGAAAGPRGPVAG